MELCHYRINSRSFVHCVKRFLQLLTMLEALLFPAKWSRNSPSKTNIFASFNILLAYLKTAIKNKTNSNELGFSTVDNEATTLEAISQEHMDNSIYSNVNSRVRSRRILSYLCYKSPLIYSNSHSNDQRLLC